MPPHPRSPTDPARLARELAEVAGAQSLPTALERAVRAAARVTGARRSLAMSERGIGLERGFAPAGPPPLSELTAAIRAGAQRVTLPGLGDQAIHAAALAVAPPAWLVVCRSGAAFTAAERDRLAAVADALSRALARLRRDGDA
jgi:hypothetical protein